MLEHHISTGLHRRVGRATLELRYDDPADQQDLARELAIDPYRLDLLAAEEAQTRRLYGAVSRSQPAETARALL